MTESPSSNNSQETPSTSSSPAKVPLPKVSRHKTSKRIRVLLASVASLVVVALAITLVVTLVIIPNRRASEEAALAEQEYQAAVDSFQVASTDCTTASTDLTNAIDHAQQTMQTDRSTMQDPTLIDKLNDAIESAEAISPCNPITPMAGTTDDIQKQVAQMKGDAQAVESAVSTLASTSQAVSVSVQAKTNADAAAAAEEERNRQQQRASAHNTAEYSMIDNEGFSWTWSITMTDWIKASDTDLANTAWKNVGGSGFLTIPTDSRGFIPNFTSPGQPVNTERYDSATTALILGTVTLTNTTSGWPLKPLEGPDLVNSTHSTGGEAVCTERSGALQCRNTPGEVAYLPSGSTLDSGQSRTWPFVYVFQLAFQPNDPNGECVGDSMIVFDFIKNSETHSVSVGRTWAD